jgi:Tol biopolymer transport system component
MKTSSFLPTLLFSSFLLIMSCDLSNIFYISINAEPSPTVNRENEDIVFQLWGEKKDETTGYGFINSDGSGVQLVPETIIVRMPTWSPDKQRIAALFTWGSFDYGYLFLAPGGVSCRDTLFYDRMHWADNKEVLRESTKQIDVGLYNRKIIQWDVITCSITKILYQEDTPNNFTDIDLSVKKTLIFTRRSKEDEAIYILEESSEKPLRVSSGFGATWSPDGTQFVFTGSDGLYISDAEGKSIQKAVDLTAYYPVKDGAIQWDDWPPMAVWSPDGRFLLYHRLNNGTYELVKFEIAEKTETVIYQGGMYPDWR